MKIRANAKVFAALFGATALMASVPMLASAQDRPQTTEAEEEGDSAQPVNDTWITTKVKADLMATSDVPGTTIDVDTTNGTVKLSGTVSSKAEADKAVSVAKNIKGVKSVDSSGLKVAKGGTK
ncbi:BON domain-containing protein [Lysobacter sp.]|uniref:BON domain-containing protein n=1 Tax=Lysobacter sp. TaxID=72226 RepID=UPI0039C92459